MVQRANSCGRLNSVRMRVGLSVADESGTCAASPLGTTSTTRRLDIARTIADPRPCNLVNDEVGPGPSGTKSSSMAAIIPNTLSEKYPQFNYWLGYSFARDFVD